jgi:Family of unknown function (DUF6309)
MNVLKESVAFEEILSCFARENRGSKSFKYTEDLLKKAIGDSWSLVRLSRPDILKIKLPHHRHPPEITLIPNQGMVLAEAAETVRELTRETGPCWDNILFHKGRDLSQTHIFLKVQGSGLEDLDGLHRLLAWAIFDMANEIPAYVAGWQEGTER